MLQVWLKHPDDCAAAISEVVTAGGDIDTAAAILGGIVGARVGREGIPAAWIDGVIDWPRSTAWVERLGTALGQGGGAPGYFFPVIVVRNLLFMGIVLAHGFRRLAPPY